MFVPLLLALPLVAAHQHHLHAPVANVENEEWYKKYGNQHVLAYTAPLSFMHLPYAKCLEDASHAFDIAILVPFRYDPVVSPQRAVKPQSICLGSPNRGYTLAWDISPFGFGARIMDCGDVPLTLMENAKAIDQMEVAYSALLARPHRGHGLKEHPRLVTLGVIVLPILRSLHTIPAIHFDAHFDTAGVEDQVDQGRISHGSYFTIAAEENPLSNTSIHSGICQKMGGRAVVEHDESVGFQVISSEDIDDYGIQTVIQKIRDRVGMGPVLDIDAGAWTTREVKCILRGLAGLNFVGCDIVERLPRAAAIGIVDDFPQMLQADAPPKPRGGPFWDDD
ncbi:arginase deacetylase [Mycena albidolilacea]|uniref:Arginase deacetylase n=1 Tax=Mycena albidolilacea TaxID=1033008 RepID=A0AAD6YY35_9AGAR|nr:arginase deacetylase [Mycena albidolilacea]